MGESTKECCRAYLKFVENHPGYDVDVKLCAFSVREMQDAQTVFNAIMCKENELSNK